MDIQKIINYICCINQIENTEPQNNPVITENKSDKHIEHIEHIELEHQNKENKQDKPETLDVSELKLQLSEIDSEMEKFEHITPIEMNLEIDNKYFEK